PTRPRAAARAQRLHYCDDAHVRQLPQLPRAVLSGVPAQSSRRRVVGSGLRRAGTAARAGRLRRALSARLRATTPAPVRRARRTLGDDERLRQLPQHRQTERRPHHRPMHGVAHPAHERRRDRAPGHQRPRRPTTCGQCHMGPDHSQLEIYEESKHGIMFQAQEKLLNLDAPPRTLSTRDMFVPTCATCHMSGINGLKVTHDPSDRLSYYLADIISKPRPNKDHAQEAMKQVCNQCHTKPLIDRMYADAEKVVATTNQQVQQATDLINGLRKEGVLTTPPFSQPIDFIYFDLWHYDGRTSKHGAFMGGADFVQWHGNYPMMARMVEMKAQAEELRRHHGR